ncbi:MAG: hypothetical protein AAF626_18860 [Pseudomonadota bacterium]
MAARQQDSANDDPAGDLETLVRALLAKNPSSLDAIAAGVLAASHLGLVNDTRTFARELGLAHALVIRSVTTLSSELGLITVDRQSDRSQRLRYSLTASGKAMVSSARR